MRINDRFQMALRNLWRRKSRTILTILSVVIGSTSIILMLAFAQGIKESQQQTIDSFGGLTTITIVDGTNGGRVKVDNATINELKRIKHVKIVVPSKTFYSEIKIDNNDEYRLDSQMMVIPNEVYKKITPDMLSRGNVPNPNDDNKILLGSMVKPYKVMDSSGFGYSMDEAPDFDFANNSYKIRLGFQTQEDDGVNFGDDEKDEEGKPKGLEYIDIPIEISGGLNSTAFLSVWGAYMSEATFKKLQKEDQKLITSQLSTSYDERGNPIVEAPGSAISYDNLEVIVDDPDNVSEVEDEIRKLGHQTQSSADIAKEVENQSRTIMLILGGIGSIAFIVSAIGIINTMIMSIYERQKEIGVMKVIGASVNDIKTMFLIESGFIGFIGGIIGLIISLAISMLINSMFSGGSIFGEGNIISIPIRLMALGVGFSALVGVLAGYLPARRATKLSAIDALRAN